MSSAPLQIVDDSPEDQEDGLLGEMRTKIKSLEEIRDKAQVSTRAANRCWPEHKLPPTRTAPAWHTTAAGSLRASLFCNL